MDDVSVDNNPCANNDDIPRVPTEGYLVSVGRKEVIDKISTIGNLAREITDPSLLDDVFEKCNELYGMIMERHAPNNALPKLANTQYLRLRDLLAKHKGARFIADLQKRKGSKRIGIHQVNPQVDQMTKDIIESHKEQVRLTEARRLWKKAVVNPDIAESSGNNTGDICSCKQFRFWYNDRYS